MPTEDVLPTDPQQPGPEAQDPQSQEPQTSPEPEPEYIPFKVRGQERQINAAYLDGIAADLGGNRDTALMWLQSGKDYAQHVTEQRARERELAQREAEVNVYLQQIERDRQTRQQAQGAQPNPQIPVEDDPIAILKWQAQQTVAMQKRLDAIDSQVREEREHFRSLMADQERERQAVEIQDAWTSFDERRKSRGEPEIPFEDIEREARFSGLASSRLPWQEVFQRAYRNLAWDAARSTTERTTIETMRSPRAKVVVAPSTGKPAAPASQTDQIGGIKLGDVIDFIPERR